MKKKGFTLIELLIAIAILGVLALLGLSNFIPSLQKGRDSKRKNDVRQIGQALEMYFNDNGKYPVATGDGKIEGCDGAVCNWGSPFKTGATYYMTKLPIDQQGSYFYFSNNNDDPPNTYFQVYTRLENTKDNDIPHAGSAPQHYDNTACRSDDAAVRECNYGISSTNVGITEPEGWHTLVNDP
jgi:prepilin-type N-terminal cleavage/methylation domain-containing protein